MYDCIVPAAGASSRMGAWKPGLPFRGGTLLSAAVGAARAAGCRVLVVSGNCEEDVPRALRGPEPSGGWAGPEPEIVRNPCWSLGMTGSLQAGMERVSTSFFFVFPADMPFVPVRAFLALAREARVREDGGLPGRPVFPVFYGFPGHPVLVPSALIPRALRLSRDARFRDFLVPLGPVYVALADPGIRTDLDTPEEYASGVAGAPPPS